VGQVGEQALNITRNGWLAAGLPMTVAATTVDAQCGSSQQATAMAAALVSAGVVDVAVGCGTEAMSRVPLGSTTHDGLGRPLPESYTDRYEATTQFEGAERIAERWGITRQDTDEFGLLSQQRAHAAWSQQRFDGQIVPIDAPVPESGNGKTRRVDRDEGLMLTGPIEATRALLNRNGMTLSDIDLVEINEAFASVVLAWQRELDPDMDRVNPNGGAIALGHPLGATGGILISKAVHELERADLETALVTMCCGGGLGTGTLLERA
jgi:acetyl-CoA C-acetyltransferase